MVLDILLFTTLTLVLIVLLALVIGAWRWGRATRALYARLDAARVAIAPATYQPSELDGLPEPVQRFFRRVLKPGAPIVAAAELTQTGQFNMSEKGQQWTAFRARQRVVTQRPAFVWDARIGLVRGAAVHVHDAYVDGRGLLRAAVGGALTVMNLAPSPELDRGEFLRYMAEAPWYPTALLPSQGVRWEAVSGTSARATLADGETSATLLFGFNEEGLIETVTAESRGRTVEGRTEQVPWHGRWWRYEAHGGMRVPTEGEVVWGLPEGEHPYWRGRLTGIRYEFAPPTAGNPS